MSEETTKTDKSDIGRQKGTDYSVMLANIVTKSIVDLFNTMVQTGWDAGLKGGTEGLVTAIHERRVNIQAQVEFDTDGVLSFQFFSIVPGEEPKKIMDALPTNTLNS